VHKPLIHVILRRFWRPARCDSLRSPALAAGGGGGLPWEGPLQQIQQSITGPVAGMIALAAVAIAGGMLIFGGELNDFARRLMYIVLVAGILLGATQIVGLFGATGASIGCSGSRATATPDGEGRAEHASPARSRIHRALSRPNLLMGADRELVLLTGLAAVILIFVVLTWYSALFGIAIWIVIVGAAHDGQGRSDDAQGLSAPHLATASLPARRPRPGADTEGRGWSRSSRFRHTGPSFADLLPYAGLVDNGVLLLKDGSLMAGWYFAGPDSRELDQPSSATRSRARSTRSCLGLGSGWMIQVEAVRIPTTDYPAEEACHFPDAVTPRSMRSGARISSARKRPFRKPARAAPDLPAAGEAQAPAWPAMSIPMRQPEEPMPTRCLPSSRHAIREVEQYLGNVVSIRRMVTRETSEREGSSRCAMTSCCSSSASALPARTIRSGCRDPDVSRLAGDG
jgi:type IV secretory pathway TrbD component/type IV secretory pathway VirB2 component (pilin)